MDVMWVKNKDLFLGGVDFFCVDLKSLFFNGLMGLCGVFCGVGPTFAQEMGKQNLPKLKVETYCCMILREV